MGTKLSAKAQQKLEVLTEARRKWDRVYSLVEQYSSTNTGEDSFLGQIYRTASDVARIFMNHGYGVMADSSNQLAMLAKRGSSKQTKLRTMRECIASVKAAIEHAEKVVIQEDAEESESTVPD
jgi:tRNA nucleotidyltransferase (CCA-adding enzyme)